MLFHMLQKITVNPRSEHVLQWLTQELKEVPDGFNWQSLEQRAEKIKALSADNNIYGGLYYSLMYICIMKLLKLFSTKGKLVFLFLLCSMLQYIYYCIGRKKYTFGFPCFYYVIWH